MLTEKVKKELEAVQKTETHQRLFQHVMSLTDMSRQYMKGFFTRWDEQHSAYKAYRTLDKDDLKAIQEGRPTKTTVPMVYAKVQTFKSFILGLYFQRPRFYELQSVGAEDEDYKELSEVLLDKDLQRNNWYNKVAQWSSHLAKHGVAILKHSWTEDYVYFDQQVSQDVMTFGGVGFGKEEVTKRTRVPRYFGNKVGVVSPYNFLPDVRHPLNEFQEGEFCADEFEISRTKLYQLQHEGVVAGLKDLPVMTSERAWTRKRWGLDRKSQINYTNPEQSQNLVRITEIQIKIVPSQFELADGSKLGTEDYPVMYLIWVANDVRIIRLEQMGYLHASFTYDLAEFDEDDHEFLNMSLVDVVQNLQNTSDWFMNSRVESVSRAIEDKLVVDPIGIEVESVKNRSRIILMKKGASRQGIDSFIKQLEVRDVTQGHLQDIGLLAQMVNSVSGVNENAQGQYHSGRRSATEARVVTQGATARLKYIAQLAWNSCMAPFGRKLLVNLRQGLPVEYIIKCAGSQYAAEDKQQALQLFKATPEDLISSHDFWVYDGTLSSEKGYTAQQLMELFQQIIQLGPQGLINLEISPKLLLEKVYELLGIPNLRAFDIQKDPQTLQNAVAQIVQQVLMQQMQQMQQPPTANENVE
jgi:hypothetical protein